MNNELDNQVKTFVRTDGLTQTEGIDEYAYIRDINGVIEKDGLSFTVRGQVITNVKTKDIISMSFGVETRFDGRSWDITIHQVQPLVAGRENRRKMPLGINWAGHGTQSLDRVDDYCKLLQFSADLAESFNKEFLGMEA